MFNERLLPPRPPTQYRKPLFDWPGGDTLPEGELKNAHKTLRRRESSTTALANYAGADTEGNQTEQGYKRRLMKRETEIRSAELELQEAKAVNNPAVAGTSIKENADLQIELQPLRTALQLTREHEASDRCRRFPINFADTSRIDFEARSSRSSWTSPRRRGWKGLPMRSSWTGTVGSPAPKRHSGGDRHIDRLLWEADLLNQRRMPHNLMDALKQHFEPGKEDEIDHPEPEACMSLVTVSMRGQRECSPRLELIYMRLQAEPVHPKMLLKTEELTDYH
jgi:hypothetical protein